MGKKYIDAVKKIEAGKLYDMDGAIQLALECASAKFDETLELHVKLGVDPRHADQQVRSRRRFRRRRRIHSKDSNRKLV